MPNSAFRNFLILIYSGGTDMDLRMRFFLLFLAVIPLLASSHSGGLDSQGGHTNRSTGEYHCHRSTCTVAPSAASQAAVIQSNDAYREAEDQGRSFSTLYDRKAWPHWWDVDGDCQDTRAEILIRDSLSPVKFKRNKGCSVSWGKWHDPYTGRIYEQASDLHIDHVVPLAWAHGHGGAGWSRKKKGQFANDFDNLLAVEAGANTSKGAQGPDDWLPPNRAYHCSYLERFMRVVQKYDLELVEVERNAIGRIQSRCLR